LPLRHPGMRSPEPLDRLERSSPGYGPGTSPSTLERQRATGLPPETRRLADVRRAVCQRAWLSRPNLGRSPPSLRRRAGQERSPPLQGSESNRQGPAYEAGSGSNPPCKASLSTQRESNPPRRLGRPVPMPIGHACIERPAGVEPAPLTWPASVQPRTPWARKRGLESRVGIEPTRTPGCSRWPCRLGDLDKRASPPGTRFTTAHPGWPHSEETERVELSGPWSGGLANRCANPTCASSPEKRRAEESNL
jgi:hypothetical protein